ncbi:MAG: hypothetical protein B6I36_02190 [Desulfobacteraceae bacterium 4572_35.1]|nr:MAG: hypothetical protein B6I36_02190 [Desulfobacteraceae bacterium 4572_35.1]
MQISGIRTHITIGRSHILRCPRCVIVSERHRPLQVATLTLPDATAELFRNFKRDDVVQIQLGYRNQQPAIWNGTVQRICQGTTRDQIEIRAVDKALPLTTTLLTQVWENETPEAIVAYAIRQTGLPLGRISQTGRVLPKVVASNITVWQLVRQIAASCQKAFDLDMSHWALWLGSAGVNWGDFDEPGPVPVIATGAGLLTHEPNFDPFGRSRIISLLQPSLRHSQQFGIKDVKRGIEAKHRALRVEQAIEPTKVRTLIDYGVENGWV